MNAKEEIDGLILDGDRAGILSAVRGRSGGGRLLRRISAMLNSTEPVKKWKAVRAVGIAAAPEALPFAKVERQVQRFLWAMNDESGAVPYGVPEALGEILAVRPELKGRILPILASYVVSEELIQTGPILAGAVWALGRVGRPRPASWRNSFSVACG